MRVGIIGDGKKSWHTCRVGYGKAILVDLTQKRLGIPVVRIVVPGLKVSHLDNSRSLPL